VLSLVNKQKGSKVKAGVTWCRTADVTTGDNRSLISVNRLVKPQSTLKPLQQHFNKKFINSVSE